MFAHLYSLLMQLRCLHSKLTRLIELIESNGIPHLDLNENKNKNKNLLTKISENKCKMLGLPPSSTCLWFVA